MMKKILLIGISGQVGRALYDRLILEYEVCGTYWKKALPFGKQLNITEKSEVERSFAEIQPDIVVLCGALTNVELCEEDTALAELINITGTRNVVNEARKHNSKLIFFSTDYIFDGKDGPYLEDAVPNPISYYGKTKLVGENLVKTLPSHLIIRTTGVFSFDEGGQNFAMQVIRYGIEGKQMKVADDQIANPILAENLACCVVELIEKEGVYNISGKTLLSRYDFALSVAECFLFEKNLIIPVLTSSLNQKAERPLNGGLKIDKAESELSTKILSVGEGLIRMKEMANEKYRDDIHTKIKGYYSLFHRKAFEAQKTKIHFGGRVYGEEELMAGCDAVLDFWLTTGKRTNSFEERFSEYLGVKYTSLVNSGSSANLIAIACLDLPKGSEVITPATTFPTTINPIIQHGLIPTLVDVEIGSYNPNPLQIEEAVSSKTRAIFIPHTLGNSCKMDEIQEIARKHNLILIEDACDALGSRYDGRLVGTFADLATFSFYPAHHITMGEGGAVVTNNHDLATALYSLRDWGRACVCQPCILTKNPEATCPKRFSKKGADLLPEDYDKRYIYTHIGYNLKATDIQAAIGLVQLERLPQFIKIRKRNFSLLYDGLKDYEDIFILPRQEDKAEPCWFSFPLTVREGIQRKDVVAFLEKANIETRMLFAGNIESQPAYKDLQYRKVGDLKNSSLIMRNTFFIGLYPGITEEIVGYILDTFHKIRKIL
ncbi:lipopolysaccharide biosynthesis protein RfbH [bacterium]|nr:lipopolysaccharide biosynthesis protein RfbH [bacterium]